MPSKPVKLPYRRSVLAQGLLLVLVPLILGAAVIACLGVLRSQTEKLAAEERKEARVVSYVNLSFIDYGLMFQVFMQRLTGENTAVDNSGVILPVQRALAKASSLAKDNPNMQVALDSINELVKLESIVLMDPNLVGTDNGQLTALLVSRQSPLLMLNIYKNGVIARKRFYDEWGHWQELAERQIDSERKMRLLVTAGIVFNVVLSSLLALVLVFPFVRRLRLLMGNVRKLYESESVERCLTGNDELAYLDETICNASKMLADFAAHRERILRMVAHDLRSPLMSAQCNLELIPEFTDDLPDESVLELQRVYRLMDTVVSRAQDMLNRDAEAEINRVENPDDEQSKSSTAHTSSFGAHHAVDQKLSLNQKFKSLVLSPSLLQQRLALIMILLIMQILPLLALNQQVLEAERGCEAETRIIDTSMRLTIVTLDIHNALFGKFDSLLRGSGKQKANAVKWLDTAELDLDELIRIDPDEMMPFVNSANSSSTDEKKNNKAIFFSNVRKFMQDGLSATTICKPNDFAPGEVLRMRRRQRNALEAVYRMESFQKTQDTASSKINDLIAWTLIADVILALLMLFLFTWRTEQRLKKILNSVTALSEGEPLPSAIPGIDEISQLDGAIHFADQKLREASAERSQMMRTLSDTMRVPLQEVLTGVDTFSVQAQKQLSERSRNYIVRVRGSVEQVLALLEDLLTVESAEIGRIELTLGAFDAAEVIDIACGAVSGLAAKKNSTVTGSSEHIQIHADKSRVVQVLVNFISNAIKFSPENTTILVSAADTGKSIRFSVTDNGTGMDEATRSRVFEERFRGLNVSKGSGFGLGLAICKLIVESHGGTIGVESEVGKGSTFWFELPSIPD
ncbi:MAG TPA: ATP-binding protein [Drouetiella sp.]